MRELLLFGLGPIGLEVLRAITKGLLKVDKVYAVAPHAEIAKAREILPKLIELDEDVAVKMKFSAVLEIAGPQKAKEYVPKFLMQGNTVIMMTSSLLADDDYMEEIKRITKAYGGRIVVPFGAVGGLDLVNALSVFEDLKVEVEVRRRPEVLADVLREAGFEVDATEDVPVVLYEGSAKEELRKVQKGINTIMAAVLAAGRDVNLRIVADASVKGSKYSLIIESPIAKAKLQAEYEVFEEDPKLSKIMAYSALRALKAVLEGVEVVVF
ncbi:hypothetical protein IPA_07135 [Ignicoccus pacificus DSM 13166]|uniref:Aspartate dehydrogenase n=1 Tax=Ignicoccus pacificus DSM 13166 TaxID=940294 RepID=A0A977KBN5_9CREN|nr:hypothetical protein IPA_07135 [Ignicoccus pacificus DSM 13166]